MGRRRSDEVPNYRHFKPRNLGFVEFNGSRTYFPGEFQSDESVAAYHEWLRNEFLIAVLAKSKQRTKLSIGQVALLYLAWAKEYYGTEKNSTYWHQRGAIKPFSLEYHDTMADDFDALMLEEYRDRFAKQKLKRDDKLTMAKTTVNDRLTRIKMMFRWAAKNRHISKESLTLLLEAKPIQAGRQEVRVLPEREAITLEQLEAVACQAEPMVADMMRMQWLTCCRPSSLFRATPKQFKADADGMLIWRPRHKNEWRGKKLQIPIGPKCEEIVRRYLERAPEAFLFRPVEMVTNRSKKEQFDREFYRKKIGQAQSRADIALEKELKRALKPTENQVWTMYQIRHGRVTAEVDSHDLTVAKAVAGHSTVKSTEVYSHADLSIAKKAARERG